jgi:hypothetical protein
LNAGCIDFVDKRSGEYCGGSLDPHLEIPLEIHKREKLSKHEGKEIDFYILELPFFSKLRASTK